MSLSTYEDLKTFLDRFMPNYEIISIMVGSDALVLIYRSETNIKDQLPSEIEYCNEHYRKKTVAVMNVKTADGYDETDIYVATFLYDPPALSCPSRHKYNLTIDNIFYSAYHMVRNVKSAEAKKNESNPDGAATNGCSGKSDRSQ